MFINRISLKIFATVLFVVLSLALSLIQTNGTSSALEFAVDLRETSVTYDSASNTFAASVAAFPDGTTPEMGVVIPEVLKGTLTETTSGGGIYSGTISRDDNCSAVATLDTTGGDNLLSFSDVSCGDNISSIADVTLNLGEDLKVDGQTTGEDVTLNSNPCNANFGLSWLTCTVLENLLGVNKLGYDVIEGLLEFRPSMISATGEDDGNTTVYKYWAVFRNIANLVLLVGFVAVIFSQATSMGLSAYGVKKLLPRLLAVAIMINLSFFMCQVLVDLSNIVGANLVVLGDSMIDSADNKIVADTAWGDVADLTTRGEETAAASVGAVGAGIASILSFGITMSMIAALALPILLVAFLALLVGLVVLIARQIIIVGMIILSPIAIASATLPGTKRFYEFWKKTFASMLFMFPIIALLFAGSRITASVVEGINFFALSGIEGDMLKFMNALVIVIILVAPFFAIPFVIKTSGGMLGKLTGALDKFSTGKARSAVKERSGEVIKDRRNQYASNLDRKQPFNPRANIARRTIARKEKYRSNDEAAKLANANIAAQQVLAPGSRATDAQRARAQTVQNELRKKEGEMLYTTRFKDDPKGAISHAINTGNVTLQNLTLGDMAKKGMTEDIDNFFSNTNPNITSESRQSAANHLLDNNFSELGKDLGTRQSVIKIASIKDDAASGDPARMASAAADALPSNYTARKDTVHTVNALRSAPPIAVTGQKENVLGRQLTTPGLIGKQQARRIRDNQQATSQLSTGNAAEINRLAR